MADRTEEEEEVREERDYPIDRSSSSSSSSSETTEGPDAIETSADEELPEAEEEEGEKVVPTSRNPFRGEESDEEAAAKYAQVFSATHEEVEDEEEAAPQQEDAPCPDFDPNQTIYSEAEESEHSDKENDQKDSDSSSWSDEEMKRLRKIKIRSRKSINQADGQEGGEKEEEEGTGTTLLPAPPKVTGQLAYQEPLTAIDENEFGSAKPAEPREEVANLWSEEMDDEESRERHANLLKAFENSRFQVDWQAPVPRYVPTALPTGAPQAVLPELPREETPDPELDRPFNEPVEPDRVWRLWLRHPEKKSHVKQVSKYTTDRSWKEVAVTLGEDRGRCVVNLHQVSEEGRVEKEPYRAVRMEPYMQLSRDKMQQYDKYGKLHIFKLNHVSYRELVGIRPEKFTLKNLQQLVSHKPKQNVALDHLPVYSEILKFGSLDHSPIRSLMAALEDNLMRIPSFKDASLNYAKEEVCCYVTDEYYGNFDEDMRILAQRARTRVFCTAFVNGGPNIVLGLNDKWRYGREVVRRSDILPIMHDDWISIRKPEFHSCLDMANYDEDHMIKFQPLDGCKFELMRFRVSLTQNLQLPMQVRVQYTIDNRIVYMRCDLLVPGFFTACRHRGAVPCEDVEIHVPVPEEWIYHFRVEKHHKMGSVHSTLRKPGKIKGFERITAMAQSFLPPSILETSIGMAKYEHLYKAVVWRIPRVPDKNEASFKPHLLTCKLLLAEHDAVPEWDTLVRESVVEYTMPSTTLSGATVRSISVESSDVVEKFVKYRSKYFCTATIDYKLGQRKEPPLTSKLDENTEAVQTTTSSSSSESSSSEQSEDEVAQKATAGTAGAFNESEDEEDDEEEESEEEEEEEEESEEESEEDEEVKEAAVKTKQESETESTEEEEESEEEESEESEEEEEEEEETSEEEEEEETSEEEEEEEVVAKKQPQKSKATEETRSTKKAHKK